jgi:hypothetical protein
MKNGFSRRGFIGALLASAASGGTAGVGEWWFGKAPKLKFGVISDIHITTPESAARFVLALSHYRDLGVDAVMVAGDLTDWGLKSSLQYMAEAWRSVFPGDRGANGEKVERLFVTGNHDLDGWRYGDMTLDMHTQGYSEKEALSKLGIAECWREVFGEKYEKQGSSLALNTAGKRPAKQSVYGTGMYGESGGNKRGGAGETLRIEQLTEEQQDMLQIDSDKLAYQLKEGERLTNHGCYIQAIELLEPLVMKYMEQRDGEHGLYV